MNNFKKLFLSLSAAGFLLTSCLNSKKVTDELKYFRNASGTMLVDNRTFEALIQKADLLQVHISTGDPVTDALYNQGAAQINIGNQTNLTGAASASQSPSSGGILVEEDGTILLPNLGKIPVAGKTKKQVADVLIEKLKTVSKNPLIDIRIINYRITVVGEVMKPGIIPVSNERISIIEALGLSGDLTNFGRRDNILVAREDSGKMVFGVVNINSAEVFKSPYYYLKQNDVVYVELNNRKVINTDQTNSRALSIITTLISVISLGVIIFKK